MIVARRLRIGGRVQGVGFRMFAAARAAAEGIHGYAKNLPDGRVEVIAAGPAAKLAELARWLWQGPPAARVDSVQVEEWEGVVPATFSVDRSA